MALTPTWGSTVTDDRLLTDITGSDEAGTTHYDVSCRTCGDLAPLTIPQSIQQAHILRLRHLSEHLTLLGAEFQEIAR